MKAMKIVRNEWESTFFGREIGSILWQDPHSAPACGGSPLRQLGVGGSNGSDFAENVQNCPLRLVSLATSPASGGRMCSFDLIVSKLPTTAFTQIAELQQLGFQLVETEMVFKQDFAFFCQDLPPCNCRTANESDLPTLKKLMGNAFPNTRFRPPFFTVDENQRFYQHWIENAVKGQFDDICLLSEQNGELQGAVSLRIVGNTAKLGLLAVAPKFQRQGIAKQLLVGAIAWAKKQQAESLEIRTQLSNLEAIRLYQAIGATISETNYWFIKQN